MESNRKDNQNSRRGRRTVALGRERPQFDHEVLDIARVVRVVKGGRRFRFRASVVVGDRAGRIGFGLGKSRDVQAAIQKAQAQAEKHMVSIVVDAGTIPHQISAHYKGAHIHLRPARPGTGVIAGDVVRTVADLAGIRDVVSKAHGSSNKISNIQATIKALRELRKL